VDRGNVRPMTGPRAIRDRYTIRDRDIDKAGYAIGGVPERVSDKPISRQNSTRSNIYSIICMIFQ
jgi:hypothetical protein